MIIIFIYKYSIFVVKQNNFVFNGDKTGLLEFSFSIISINSKYMVVKKLYFALLFKPIYAYIPLVVVIMDE